MNRKTLFFFVAGVLLLVFVSAVTLFKNHQADQQRSVLQQNSMERKGAPQKGAADAKVTIVEFFDPACATCRDFYPRVHQLVEHYSGKVKVMLRYAPLHTGSDQVVTMLQAAHLQDKFWQALEKLFMTQDQWVINHVSQPMRARAILGSLDMDQEKLSQDIHDPEVIQAVSQDVQDGKTLLVRATPEFFVNGQPLPSFGFEPLRLLVKEAVIDQYGRE